MKKSTKKSYDAPGTLLEKTRELLKNDTRPLLEIYKETDIPYFWLVSFLSGKVSSPSVNRVQYLYESLSKKELSV